jgi:hypothetical protein
MDGMNRTEQTVSIIEPYKIVGNTVTVCMWCFPGDSILSLFPDLKGLAISHGICQRHSDRWMSELALQRMADGMRPYNTAYSRMGLTNERTNYSL